MLRNLEFDTRFGWKQVQIFKKWRQNLATKFLNLIFSSEIDFFFTKCFMFLRSTFASSYLSWWRPWRSSKTRVKSYRHSFYIMMRATLSMQLYAKRTQTHGFHPCHNGSCSVRGVLAACLPLHFSGILPWVSRNNILNFSWISFASTREMKKWTAWESHGCRYS